MFRTHYSNLGVSENATLPEIKAAVRRLARLYHPDRNRDLPPRDANDSMLAINQAWDCLSDSVQRAHHDAWIVAHRPAPAPPPPPPRYFTSCRLKPISPDLLEPGSGRVYLGPALRWLEAGVRLGREVGVLGVVRGLPAAPWRGDGADVRFWSGQQTPRLTIPGALRAALPMLVIGLFAVAWILTPHWNLAQPRYVWLGLALCLHALTEPLVLLLCHAAVRRSRLPKTAARHRPAGRVRLLGLALTRLDVINTLLVLYAGGRYYAYPIILGGVDVARSWFPWMWRIKIPDLQAPTGQPLVFFSFSSRCAHLRQIVGSVNPTPPYLDWDPGSTFQQIADTARFGFPPTQSSPAVLWALVCNPSRVITAIVGGLLIGCGLLLG